MRGGGRDGQVAGRTSRAVARAVGVRLLLALVLVSVVAGVLTALGVADYRSTWGWGAVGVGALVGITANDTFTRASEIDAATVYGAGLRPGPDRSRDAGGGLTGLGVFLLVGLPLAVAGLVVLSV
ncbi:hypothetical protein WDZ17_07725 [Pseudokineococcus basanitobsidens]|uniref:Phosphatidate cytidylyltransferase n=1 Tax=Pseudokineococcus basanitobsidens TaxID=1926649 RepID=A0ABU8RJG3_9ACTN